ncbi:MAG: folate-binding protein [Pseudomonadota bacterium]
MTSIVLNDRAVLRVTGDDRIKFLDGLVTAAITDAAPGTLIPCALLTPQGKVIADMIAHIGPDNIALDLSADAAPGLAKRLQMYTLRAAVTVTATQERVRVLGDGSADPRAPSLGGRSITADAPTADRTAYDDARITAIVPEGPDIALGGDFPHDLNMDMTGAVDFRKGCFVGQEVVSRMKHRGTARRRTVRVIADGPLPEPGAEVTAGGRTIGRLGTVVGNRGLTLVRIDRTDGVGEIAGQTVHFERPDNAPFQFAEPATPANT